MRDKISALSVKTRVMDTMSRRVHDALEQHDPELRWTDKSDTTIAIAVLEGAIIEQLLEASDDPKEAESPAFIAQSKEDRAELGALYAQAISDPSRGEILAGWFIEDAQSALTEVLSRHMTPEEEAHHTKMGEWRQKVRDKLRATLPIQDSEDKNPPFRRS